ncbi:MAG: type II secretion system F family protein [Phycisphaerales bacterium]|nr:type II secretion system F family protein [Phycisphaerales bacterium]
MKTIQAHRITATARPDVEAAPDAPTTRPPATSRDTRAMPKPGATPRRRRTREGRRLPTLVWFSRQLFVLTSSGMPLVQAIASLERQAADPEWRQTLANVRRRVEEGSSLADALALDETYFDAVFVSLVSAGESSGQLPAMLNRLTRLGQQQLQTRRAVVGALVYPALLTCVAGFALGAMIIFVLPRFEMLFETLAMPMPPTTELLMGLSEVLRGFWWIIIPMLGVLVGLGVWYLKTEAGGRRLDAFSLRAPRVGPLVRSFATARIARLMGVLITAHVPLLEAMQLVRRSLTNSLYVDLMERAEDAVGRGESISGAMNDPHLIPASVYEAIRSGESSGQVGELMLDIADFLDDENSTTIRSLTNILEPLILIVLGLMVGFVAISLFLPLFDLTAMTQGGGAQ